jgi:hypothetical protein
MCFSTVTENIYNFRGTRLPLHRGNEKARDAAIVIWHSAGSLLQYRFQLKNREVEVWRTLWRALPLRMRWRAKWL